MKAKQRNTGYYWVRYSTEWEVALWDKDLLTWFMVATTQHYTDDEFQEIKKHQIRFTK